MTSRIRKKRTGGYLQLHKIVSTLSLEIFKEINLVLPCPTVIFNRVLIIPNISGDWSAHNVRKIGYLDIMDGITPH